MIVRFHFNVMFETFRFSEWQVLTLVEATVFHSSAISFTNFSHKEFILGECASLQLWKSFVTLCVDRTSKSHTGRTLTLRSSRCACVLVFLNVMQESRSDLVCDSRIRNSTFFLRTLLNNLN